MNWHSNGKRAAMKNRSIMHNVSGRTQWYVSRLARMSVAEISTRAIRYARDLVERKLHLSHSRKLSRRSVDLRDVRTKQGWLPELSWDLTTVDQDQHDLLNGIVRYGIRDWTFAMDQDVWRQAEYGTWPNCFHTKIDCRPGNSNGDVRWTWEPNRLQQLIGLALLARHYPDRRIQAVEAIQMQLQSWLDENPPLIGVNYISAMECALRILSVLFAAHIAHPYMKDNPSFWNNVSSLVDNHARFVYGRLSLGSSLGNHTIAEASGLYIAGLVFKGPQSERWQKRGLRALRLACAKEFHQDGGGAEQSPSYHALIVDLLYVVGRTAECHGPRLEDIENYHRMGASYLQAISNRGQLPRIGDDDSSYSLSRYMQPSWSAFKAEKQDHFLTFSESGLSIVNTNGFVLYFDHGPVGMGPNFAHGHADGLSILLHKDNFPILVDAGTCSYSNVGGWRDYFRSAAAHNTLHGGQADQAVSAGPFLWSHPSKASLICRKQYREKYFLLGALSSRSGYIHRRALSFSQNFLLVIDEIRNIDPAQVRLRWHFDDELIQSGHSYQLSKHSDIAVSIPNCALTILRGSTDPRAGWMSPEYGKLNEATTLEASFPRSSNRIVSCFSFSGSSSLTQSWVQDELAALFEFAADGGTHEP